MNLKSGKLFWTEGTTKFQYPMLTENIKCDVLIIGGGVSGAICAYFLSMSGMKVVVVDKREIGMGSSSANTGLLQFCSDKTLTSCINSFGVEKAVRFYELCANAIGQLEEIVSRLDIDTEFKLRNSFYFASSEEDREQLLMEHENLLKYGFSAEYEQSSIDFPFATFGSIYSKGDAEVNPYLLVHGLLDKAINMGANVYQHTEIIHHKKETFYTKNHVEIRAKKALFTTGYESQEIRKERNSVLSSSYAIVTKQVPNFHWREDCLIWETARPYLYVRRTDDRRIIIGGLDEDTINLEERDSKLFHKKDLLLEKLHTFFPNNQFEIDYWWGATFGSTYSGLPIIGEYEGFENCYFLLGYGGNGTVYSVILAQVIRDLILLGEHKDTDLFCENKV